MPPSRPALARAAGLVVALGVLLPAWSLPASSLPASSLPASSLPASSLPASSLPVGAATSTNTTSSSTPVVRVDVGGGPFTDAAGQVWSADTAGSDGRVSTLGGGAVSGTADDPLFASLRVHLTRYAVPVPQPGTYRVTLLMQENYHSAPGRRVFSVSGEGRPLARDLDLFARVGKSAAHRVTADVPVSDGVLSLAFAATVDGATLSGVEVALVAAAPEPGAPPPAGTSPAFPLRASADGRSLVDASGRPFLYLADTPWLAPSRLTQPEVVELLDTRRRQGFTAVQVSALDFLHLSDARNAYGSWPFAGPTDLSRPLEAGARTTDATSPAYDYWDHVAWIVEQAGARGMAVTLVPSWYGYAGEDWRGHVSTSAATTYGTFLGRRLGHLPNLVWLLGGDNNPGTATGDVARVPAGLDRGSRVAATDAMAGAIRAAEPVRHLMTYHAARTVSSYDAFAGRPWHTLASAYGNERTHLAVAGSTGRGLPVVLTEAYYDARTRAPYLDARALRAQAWWSVLHGAGFAYGHEAVWDLDGGWRSGLGARSATDVTRVAAVLGAARPVHASPTVLASGAGSTTGADRAVTGRAGATAWTYVPTARTVGVDMDALGGTSVALSWVDPATGARSALGSFPASGTRSLAWPGWADAVLVMTAS